jgi:hypothetical protein
MSSSFPSSCVSLPLSFPLVSLWLQMSRRDSTHEASANTPGPSSIPHKEPTSPKDDTFDPYSLQQPGADGHSNLIRGTSLRTTAPSHYTNTNRLTYVDEDFNYYSNHPNRPQDDHADASLVENAAKIDGHDTPKGGSRSYQDLGEWTRSCVVGQ